MEANGVQWHQNLKSRTNNRSGIREPWEVFAICGKATAEDGDMGDWSPSVHIPANVRNQYLARELTLKSIK